MPGTTTQALDPQTLQLGAAIRAARLSKSLTLVELARLSNLSHPFLSQLERGHARPSMASLERIARALETSQLELLAGAAEQPVAGSWANDDALVLEDGVAAAAASASAAAATAAGASADARPGGATPTTMAPGAATPTTMATGAATLVRRSEGIRGPYAEGEGRVLVDGRARFQPMEFCGANLEFGDFYRHAEDEFITVVEGEIVVDLEAAGLNALTRGDSLYFVGGTPHRWRSAFGEPYRLLIVKQRFVAAENGQPARVTLWSKAATAATFAPAPAFEVVAAAAAAAPRGVGLTETRAS
ncbi:helix-turn-helix domain-containing protein [Subtercola sp. YIM 133946]|uniref:helix-turn-helix domain-containing protein n=1 Tax=Subtercola sp. YIM 133946 TaxID=3118909 RepID=UPI002F95BBBE